ncbi:MAG: hypothetical protein OXG27_14095 [Chloroflexi bacterium]|nr:hypothetical protein [Chloroflexota bacterium]
MTTVYHADGKSPQSTYLVNIFLPNRVVYPAVTVAEAKLLDGLDVIIGMDIIKTGDLAVTNFDGNSKFSFRVPSQTHIDFVEDVKRPTFKLDGKPKRKNDRSKRRTRSKRGRRY